jgi:signal transduction histidine kinase
MCPLPRLDFRATATINAATGLPRDQSVSVSPAHSTASLASPLESSDMTQEAPVRDPLLELSDALARHQLRQAGAEVAAAIAHAVGTPLNVISGRAELIRHDPSNALAQVGRIEEQVKKLANGLRQVVDYLAVPDPISPGKAAPGESASASPAAARPPLAEVVEAKSVLDDLAALAEPLARSAGVQLVVSADGLAGARVERWNALGTLQALVSSALRQAAPDAVTPGGARAAQARVRVSGSIASQGVLFELAVPGLTLIEGWQLENFPARPALDCAEFYRTMSICGAVVRGHGGRLALEAAPGGDGVVVRFSCRNEAA